MITGGLRAKTTVTLYNDAGYVHELPVLNEGRHGHGCGFFVNSEQKIVSKYTKTIQQALYANM